jgi:hypothetical protein
MTSITYEQWNDKNGNEQGLVYIYPNSDNTKIHYQLRGNKEFIKEYIKVNSDESRRIFEQSFTVYHVTATEFSNSILKNNYNSRTLFRHLDLKKRTDSGWKFL